MAPFVSTCLLFLATVSLLDEGFMIGAGSGATLSSCALLLASMARVHGGERHTWVGFGIAASAFALGVIAPLPAVSWLALLWYVGSQHREYVVPTAWASALTFFLEESRYLGLLGDLHVPWFDVPLAVRHFLPTTAVYLTGCVASVRGSLRSRCLVGFAVVVPIATVSIIQTGRDLLPSLTAVQDATRVLAALLAAVVVRVHAQPTLAPIPWRAWFASGLASGLVLLPWYVAPPTPARVLILDEGGVEWDVPKKGTYGPFSVGMFGLLPEYLEAAGCKVHRERLPAGDQLRREHLAGHDTLLCINNARRWASEEAAAVEQWVADGGLLFVLCDHTDVFGLAEGTNRLLGSMGAHVRFDSAYPMQPSWRGCLRTSSAAQRVWSRSLLASGGSWGIGCAFDLSSQWRPLLTGHRCFSDGGNYGNVSGSYLGNYAWDPGEQVGGLPLVAGRSWGRGHVFVYGDTGWFQNGTTVGAFERCLAPCFSTALCAAVEFSVWREIGCVGAVVWLLSLGLRRQLAGSFVGGLWCAMIVLDAVAPGAVPSLVVDSRCFVEITGIPRDIGHYYLHYNSIASIRIAAARANRRVLELPLDDPRAFAAGTLALVAPARELDATEQSSLSAYVRQGGELLVVASGPEADHCARLLAEAGFKGGTRVTGARSSRGASEAEPRFVTPGVIVERAELIRHATVGGRLVAASARLGDGWVHWICDSRFLSDVNTEGPNGVVPANLYLLDKIIGGSVAERADVPNGGGPR